MNTEQSYWKDYEIHGDSKKLDAIVATSGFLSLDRNDIVTILKTDGDSYIATGTGTTLGEAMAIALEEVPCPLENVTDMLLAIWCSDNRELPMPEMDGVREAIAGLAFHTNIKWGLFADPALKDSFKVTIVAAGTLRRV